MKTAALSAALGLATHAALTVTNLELENFLLHAPALIVCSLLGLFYAYQLAGASTVESLSEVTRISIAFTSGLLLSIGAYRVVFHRLRRFPGPFPAKFTKFYGLSLAAKNVQYQEELSLLHQEFGDFVRTGKLIRRSPAVQN